MSFSPIISLDNHLRFFLNKLIVYLEFMSNSDFPKIRSDAENLRYHTDGGAVRKISMGYRLFTWILNIFSAPFGIKKIDLIETCYRKSLQGRARTQAAAQLGETHTVTRKSDKPVANTLLTTLKAGISASENFNAEEFRAIQGLGIARTSIAAEYAKETTTAMVIEGLSFDVPIQTNMDLGRDWTDLSVNGRSWLDVEREYNMKHGKEPLGSPENGAAATRRIVSTIAHMDEKFDSLSPDEKRARLQNILTSLFFMAQNFAGPPTNHVINKHGLGMSGRTRVLSLTIANNDIHAVVKETGRLLLKDYEYLGNPDSGYSYEMERSTSIIKDDPKLEYCKITYLPTPLSP